MAKHARSQSNDEDGLRHPSTKRAKEIDARPPMEELSELLRKQKTDHPVRNVIHWFRVKDIRQEDNRGLNAAAQKVKTGEGLLITIFVFSPNEWVRHGTSPARSNFILQTLAMLKETLKQKNIPLIFLNAEAASEKVHKVMEFAKQYDVSHIYGNLEYEIDELRRDIRMAKKTLEENSVSLVLLHDQTVVEPGALKAGAGGPLKVFTPYHRAWLAEVKSNPRLLDILEAPQGNDKKALSTFKVLFDSNVPTLPKQMQFASKSDEKRMQKLWPPGHDAGIERLNHFLDKKAANYARDRSFPAKDVTSRLSPYFAAGVISVREALKMAKEFDGGDDFGQGDIGIASWVREIVFREFYRQTLVHTPHDAMNLPHNLKFDFVKWEDDNVGWKKWCEGKTGVPFIDAGMRQLNTEAFMHNRLRMNTASYLRTNLLIDYRKGERYFAEHLIDWDLSNNTQGWEPSYTVFNPVIQAEKCDKDGEYIRKWVPELKGIKGKAVFAPHDRLSKAEFEKLGYPKPHVDYAKTKERAISRFKQNLADAEP